MSRLNAATTLEELSECLHEVSEYGLGDANACFQFRPRTTSAQDNWTLVTKDHLVNLEANNYRIGEAPRLSLYGNVVSVRDEDGSEAARIPVTQAQNVVRMARKARRNKEAIDLEEGEEGNPLDGFSLAIYKDGSVKAGCQEFEFEEIEEFARQQGWR